MSDSLSIGDEPPLFIVEDIDQPGTEFLQTDTGLVGQFPCEVQLTPLVGLDRPGPPNAALVQQQANFRQRRYDWIETNASWHYWKCMTYLDLTRRVLRRPRPIQRHPRGRWKSSSGHNSIGLMFRFRFFSVTSPVSTRVNHFHRHLLPNYHRMVSPSLAWQNQLQQQQYHLQRQQTMKTLPDLPSPGAFGSTTLTVNQFQSEQTKKINSSPFVFRSLWRRPGQDVLGPGVGRLQERPLKVSPLE